MTTNTFHTRQYFTSHAHQSINKELNADIDISYIIISFMENVLFVKKILQHPTEFLTLLPPSSIVFYRLPLFNFSGFGV